MAGDAAQPRLLWISPSVAGRLLTGALGGGAAAVAVMWLHHTPHDLTTTSDYALAIGRLAGLLTGYAVIVLVALMARIPILEKAVGADRLTKGHAFLGRYTVLLLLLHVGCVTWGYARSARVPIPHEISLLVWSYPDVALATVAAALLLLLAAASAGAARRAVRYEVWYYPHLLSYLAIALAFSHQLANGQDFVHDKAARVAWCGLYLTVGAAVLYYRLFRPIAGAFRSRLTVARIAAEDGGVVSIVLRGRRLAELGAKSGQFFRLRFLTPGLWWQCHPFSLSAPPESSGLRFTMKPIGDHTKALQEMTVGTRVLASGPFGTLTADLRRRSKVLLIAGGIGITPLRALFETLPAGRGDLTLIYRCRSEHELIFRSELDSLAADRGADVVYVVGRSSELDAPLSADNLLRTVPDLVSREVFLCAPPRMIADVMKSLRIVGVPLRHIHCETFHLIDSRAGARRRAVVASAFSLGLTAALGVHSQLFDHKAKAALAADVSPAGVRSATATSGVPTPSGQITVVGAVERTLFSSVQVAAVLVHGRLVDVHALILPNVDARSRQLSAMSEPILRREAIVTDGTRIDSVSGASYTSAGYAQSLQSALDQAGR
ncbi:MAG TPA: ferric reductase-like transmembrane domain-containing protein [Jatrophihabitans sp.]|jgi:predicted ferric reductase/uncharacterized protein with FMN-binding domain